jgi:hypothetical protein
MFFFLLSKWKNANNFTESKFEQNNFTKFKYWNAQEWGHNSPMNNLLLILLSSPSFCSSSPSLLHHDFTVSSLVCIKISHRNDIGVVWQTTLISLLKRNYWPLFRKEVWIESSSKKWLMWYKVKKNCMKKWKRFIL